MRGHEARIVEAVLYEYPAICLSFERRRRELEASAGPGDGGVVQGGIMIPEQERIFDNKIRDVEYCELSAIIERIGGAIIEAPEEMREVLRRVFFLREDVESVGAEMGYSRRSIYIKRGRILAYMKYACMDVYKVVWRWRDREAERMRRALIEFHPIVDNLCTPVTGSKC